MARRPTGECPVCKTEVPLTLYWVQSGAGEADWRLRSRCSRCRRELGLVKQTQDALKSAPAKVPQLFLDFGQPEGPTESKVREIDPS